VIHVSEEKNVNTINQREKYKRMQKETRVSIRMRKTWMHSLTIKIYTSTREIGKWKKSKIPSMLTNNN
jgi:hypothetical protein